MPYAVRGVCVFLQELGYTRMVLKSDGEPSITALVTAVQKEWAGDSKNFQRQLIPRTSPVDDHASNGAVEAMVHSLEGLTRTSKIALEEALGVSILPTSPILPWLVRHQSYLRNRFVARSCGRTPFKELTMSQVSKSFAQLRRGSSGKRVWSPRGQIGFVVGPWHLVGQIDKDQRTSCRHQSWRDQGQDGKETSWNTEMGQRIIRRDEFCALVD